MSAKSRYHRTADGRRRGRGVTGSGLSIAVGGAMAAAFLSMGTASADVADTEPDPFTDLLGANASATDLATAHAADMTLVTANPDLAASLDNLYDVNSVDSPIDNDVFQDLLGPNATAVQLALALLSGGGGTFFDEGFDSGVTAPVSGMEPDPYTDLLDLGPNATDVQLGEAAELDKVLAQLEPGFAAQLDDLFDTSPIPPGDNDPFEDLLPANAPATQVAQAIVLDNALYNNVLNPGDPLAGTLDAQIDSALDTEPDPFLDALPATATAQQIADATAADQALATLNLPVATRLDALVDAGSLPTGSPTDADAFSDLGLANGAALDIEFPTLAQSLDPGVDQIVAPPIDNDPFTDLAQLFALTPLTGAGDPLPTDFVGVFASELDSLAASAGLANILDQGFDQIISLFGTTAF